MFLALVIYVGSHTSLVAEPLSVPTCTMTVPKQTDILVSLEDTDISFQSGFYICPIFFLLLVIHIAQKPWGQRIISLFNYMVKVKTTFSSPQMQNLAIPSHKKNTFLFKLNSYWRLGVQRCVSNCNCVFISRVSY